jgi:ABC-2 type transport system ATP-binding protein
VQNVSKRYGNRPAVSHLDLDVAPSEVLGFLGPNGAGKTTTIRILMGFIRPDSGNVRLLGRSMTDPAEAQLVRKRLGYAPDVAGLDQSVTGAAFLDELAALQGLPPLDRLSLLKALDLHPADLRRPLGHLSRGTRQKINIAQALQHRPDLLVLDEPTEGLDPLTKRAFFSLLRNAQKRGATIFFSSHVLSEVEELCDRVALIRAGRLAAVERIATLRSHMRRRVMLRLSDGAPPSVVDRLRGLPTVEGLVSAQGELRFLIGDLPPLLRLVAALPVVDMTIEPPTLEEIFFQYYGDAPLLSADETGDS